MTFLTRQNPFNDLFEPFFGRFNFGDQLPTTWAPPVDVAEEADKILVRVEVPGMNEKDLRVHFEDGLLTVSGERQFEKRDDLNYHRIERSYGSFVRTFSLPRSIDGNKISAAYNSGVLEIAIPKLEEAKPKQIQINVGSQKQINS